MTTISDFEQLVPLDGGLCVVSTPRHDGTAQASVVNTGVVEHPVLAPETSVSSPWAGARKLTNHRERPRATVVIRANHDWVAVEGAVDLVGPDDDLLNVGDERRRTLLRDIFEAAGDTHDDWPAYDRAMVEDRRVAVLVTPERAYSNG